MHEVDHTKPECRARLDVRGGDFIFDEYFVDFSSFPLFSVSSFFFLSLFFSSFSKEINGFTVAALVVYRLLNHLS